MPIHTLNARGNSMLEVIRDYFKLSPEHMHREIQHMRRSVEEILASKGISYDRLRSALVPDRKRREIALVFDTLSVEASWYGNDVFERLIPLFDRRSNHSVLVGDYLDQPGHADQLFLAFQDAVQLRRPVEYRYPTQFFIVYLNNLTDAMVRRFDEGLGSYRAYVGYAEMTYGSAFKFYLSTMLVNLGIKHGSFIIQGHEPDRPNSDDVNTAGYSFEEAGFICRSLSSDLEGVLLSYKIERPVIPGFEADIEFALNAISLTPMPLSEFRVEVEDAKLAYVKKAKAGSVERAGLDTISTSELADQIRSKISASYIYNLMFLEEYGVAKFNIILEFSSDDKSVTRLLAALEYRPSSRSLKLLTLF